MKKQKIEKRPTRARRAVKSVGIGKQAETQ